ncbi:hypothetical protein pb186bvf_004706 [Paramecium bursaria]
MKSDDDDAPIEILLKDTKQQVKKRIQRPKQKKAVKLQRPQLNNLFDEEPLPLESSNTNTISQVKNDESLQRNINERLPEKVIKGIKMPTLQQNEVFQLNMKPKKIIRYDSNFKVETIPTFVAPQQPALQFLRSQLFDRNANKRASIQKIIGRKVN